MLTSREVKSLWDSVRVKLGQGFLTLSLGMSGFDRYCSLTLQVVGRLKFTKKINANFIANLKSKVVSAVHSIAARVSFELPTFGRAYALAV